MSPLCLQDAACRLPIQKKLSVCFFRNPNIEDGNQKRTEKGSGRLEKFNLFVKTFTNINIRFYKKDAENGAYIEWEDWENRAGETDPSFDKTLIYEAVFQKKIFLRRKYKCINIAGEYLGKQHPVATKFARLSYTPPLAEDER